MRYLFILTVLLSSLYTFGQDADKVEKLIKEGIALHDKGKYPAAIKKYENALSIDKNNGYALFEATLTYTAMKEYKKAIEYCDILLDNDITAEGQVYVNKATAYDLMGEPEKAIKVYKEGIDKHPFTYLLHFNLAITYAGQKDFENAAPSFEEALKLNPEHTTSNLQLAVCNFVLDNNIRALLGTYYFLLLEPEGQRASSALKLMDVILGTGVERKSNTEININIPSESLDTNDIFQATKLMLPMLAAADITGYNENKSKFDAFLSNTKMILGLVSNAKEKDKNDFYVKLYVYFFDEMTEKGHLETFCYWITQSKFKESATWVKKNEDKVNKFVNWFLEYTKNNDLKNDTTIGLDPNKKGKPAQIKMTPTDE